MRSCERSVRMVGNSEVGYQRRCGKLAGDESRLLDYQQSAIKDEGTLYERFWGRALNSSFQRRPSCATNRVQEWRAVSVHTAAMTEALRKLYGAEKLANELLTGVQQ